MSVALWAINVLDAWAELHQKPTPSPRRVSRTVLPTAFNVYVPPGAGNRKGSSYFGSNPDGARLAAADGIWPELPEEVRKQIGERPC